MNGIGQPLIFKRVQAKNKAWLWLWDIVRCNLQGSWSMSLYNNCFGSVLLRCLEFKRVLYPVGYWSLDIRYICRQSKISQLMSRDQVSDYKNVAMVNNPVVYWLSLTDGQLIPDPIGIRCFNTLVSLLDLGSGCVMLRCVKTWSLIYSGSPIGIKPNIAGVDLGSGAISWC